MGDFASYHDVRPRALDESENLVNLAVESVEDLQPAQEPGTVAGTTDVSNSISASRGFRVSIQPTCTSAMFGSLLFGAHLHWRAGDGQPAAGRMNTRAIGAAWRGSLLALGYRDVVAG